MSAATACDRANHSAGQGCLTIEAIATRANIRKAPRQRLGSWKRFLGTQNFRFYSYEPKKAWLLVRLGETWGG